MERKQALIEQRAKIAAECAQRRENAKRAGKEGKGTHRNAGDAGRVSALWMESKRDLERLEFLISQEASQ